MIGAAIKKDVVLVLRDRAAVGSLFLLPVVFMLIFGLVFGGNRDDHARGPRVLPVHSTPGNAMAERLVGAVDAAGVFRTEMVASAEDLRRQIAEGKHLAGLVIPPDFDPRAGKPAELVIDLGLSPQVRGPIQGAITGILTIAYLGDPARGPVSVVEASSPPGVHRPLQGASGFQIAVPGNAVLFGFFLALTMALSFVEERKSGTWRRLVAAPVPRWILLVSRLVPFYVIGLVQMAFLFGTGAVVFGMVIAGSLAGVILLTMAVVFAATSLGLLIAALGGTQKQVGGIGSICILVMALLGGSMVPRPVMPAIMQTIGLFTPHAWALDGFSDLLVRQGTSVGDVWQDIAAVAGFGVLFATIGALRFRFDR